jgi:hypothetical protein
MFPMFSYWPSAIQMYANDVPVSELFFIVREQTYPIQKQSLPVDYLRDHFHLRTRADGPAATLRLRDAIQRSLHRYFEVRACSLLLVYDLLTVYTGLWILLRAYSHHHFKRLRRCWRSFPSRSYPITHTFTARRIFWTAFLPYRILSTTPRSSGQLVIPRLYNLSRISCRKIYDEQAPRRILDAGGGVGFYQ